jgi:hypothetical protein
MPVTMKEADRPRDERSSVALCQFRVIRLLSESFGRRRRDD